MGVSGAGDGGQWGWKWGAVGLKMGGSAEIPNFSPVQALKMGGSGSENGAHCQDPKSGPNSGSENGAQHNGSENGGQWS